MSLSQEEIDAVVEWKAGRGSSPAFKRALQKLPHSTKTVYRVFSFRSLGAATRFQNSPTPGDLKSWSTSKQEALKFQYSGHFHVLVEGSASGVEIDRHVPSRQDNEQEFVPDGPVSIRNATVLESKSKRDGVMSRKWKKAAPAPKTYSIKGGRLVKEIGPIASGLAVVAKDTGRMLMIQRALSPNDRNGGCWEFPGGHINETEQPLDAAKREWQEETGIDLPPDALVEESWQGKNGKYVGFKAYVDKESDIDLLDRQQRNPDGDRFEAVTWVHPDVMEEHHLRPELLADLDEVRKGWLDDALRPDDFHVRQVSGKWMIFQGESLVDGPYVSEGEARAAAEGMARKEGLQVKSYSDEELKEFAKEVNEIAREGQRERETRAPTEEDPKGQRGARFGDKVFIYYVQLMMGMPKSQFREMLIEANRKNLVELSRADLVQVMHPDDVRQSQMEAIGTFNFIRPKSATASVDKSVPSWVKTKLLELYRKYEERYGPKTALAMAIAIPVTFPIPGAMTSIIGGAELLRWLGIRKEVEWVDAEVVAQGIEEAGNLLDAEPSTPIETAAEDAVDAVNESNDEEIQDMVAGKRKIRKSANQEIVRAWDKGIPGPSDQERSAQAHVWLDKLVPLANRLSDEEAIDTLKAIGFRPPSSNPQRELARFINDRAQGNIRSTLVHRSKSAEAVSKMTRPARLLKWDDETNSADFVISTEDVDRDGDTLDMDGIDLSEYKNNPVVCLNHDTDDISIGVSEDPQSGELMIRKVMVGDKPQLVSRVYFNMADDKARRVAEAVKGGFMRAASVSFDPIDGETQKNSYGGSHYRRWKLIEWSVVTVPANAGAVRAVRALCKKLGVKMVEKASDYTEVLRQLAKEVNDGRWGTGSDLRNGEILLPKERQSEIESWLRANSSKYEDWDVTPGSGTYLSIKLKSNSDSYETLKAATGGYEKLAPQDAPKVAGSLASGVVDLLKRGATNIGSALVDRLWEMHVAPDWARSGTGGQAQAPRETKLMLGRVLDGIIGMAAGTAAAGPVGTLPGLAAGLVGNSLIHKLRDAITPIFAAAARANKADGEGMDEQDMTEVIEVINEVAADHDQLREALDEVAAKEEQLEQVVGDNGEEKKRKATSPIWEMGYDAFKAGKSGDENPYPPGDNNELWRNGYVAARMGKIKPRKSRKIKSIDVNAIAEKIGRRMFMDRDRAREWVYDAIGNGINDEAGIIRFVDERFKSRKTMKAAPWNGPYSIKREGTQYLIVDRNGKEVDGSTQPDIARSLLQQWNADKPKSRKTGKGKNMKRKLWRNKSNPVKGWALKAEGDEVDEEMAEYLEDNGMEEVTFEDEPPPEEEYEEVKPEEENPEKQFSRIQEFPSDGTYYLVGTNGKLTGPFRSRQEADRHWEQHDLSYKSKQQKGLKEDAAVGGGQVKGPFSDAKGEYYVVYGGSKNTLGQQFQLESNGDGGVRVRDSARKSKADGDDDLVKTIASKYDSKMDDDQLDRIMDEEGVPEEKRYRMAKKVKSYQSKSGFKALDKVLKAIDEELQGNEEKGGVEQTDVVNALEKCVKLLQAAKAKAYPEAEEVAEKAEEMMEKRASLDANSSDRAWNKWVGDVARVLGDTIPQMESYLDAKDVASITQDYENGKTPQQAAAAFSGKSKMDVLDGIVKMDEDTAIDTAMEELDVPEEKRWTVKRMAKSILFSKRFNKAWGVYVDGTLTADFSTESQARDHANDRIEQFAKHPSTAGRKVEVRQKSGAALVQKRLSKADEEAVDSVSEDLSSMAEGQDLPKHLKGTVKSCVDKLQSLKRKMEEPAEGAANPDEEAQAAEMLKQLKASREELDETTYETLGKRVSQLN